LVNPAGPPKPPLASFRTGHSIGSLIGEIAQPAIGFVWKTKCAAMTVGRDRHIRARRAGKLGGARGSSWWMPRVGGVEPCETTGWVGVRARSARGSLHYHYRDRARIPGGYLRPARGFRTGSRGAREGVPHALGTGPACGRGTTGIADAVALGGRGKPADRDRRWQVPRPTIPRPRTSYR